MKRDELTQYRNKKVKLELHNGLYFSGVVLELGDDSLTMKDKFGKYVTISSSQISFIRGLEQGVGK